VRAAEGEAFRDVPVVADAVVVEGVVAMQFDDEGMCFFGPGFQAYYAEPIFCEEVGKFGVGEGMHGSEAREHIGLVGRDVLLFGHGIFVFKCGQRLMECLNMRDEIGLSALPGVVDEV
jgi:hypothetical protein